MLISSSATTLETRCVTTCGVRDEAAVKMELPWKAEHAFVAQRDVTGNLTGNVIVEKIQGPREADIFPCELTAQAVPVYLY